MTTEQDVGGLVERFIDDVGAILRRVQDERRAEALRVVESTLRDVLSRSTSRLGTSRASAPRPTSRSTPSANLRTARERSETSANLRTARERSETSANLRTAPERSETSANLQTAGSAFGGAPQPSTAPAKPRVTVLPPMPSKRARQPARRAAVSRQNGLAGATEGLGSEREPRDASPSSVERDEKVLDAVRFLVRATAPEIARRAGLPSATVYVRLRALMASGRVARTDAARGIEYSLVSTGGIRPFKRARAASPETGEPAQAD